MAYSIAQEPNQLAAANSPMVFVLKESSSVIYNADKFRYIAQIFISTTNDSTWVETAKIKIHKNNSNVGIVDVHKIVRTYLETQEDNIGDQETIDGSIHSIGISETSNSYSQNRGQLVGVKLVGGYEKASSATAAPEENLAPETDAALYTRIIYSIPASTPYTDIGTNVGGLDIDGTNNPLTNYIPSSSTKKFLTNAPNIQFIRGSSTAGDNVDELTVAFINDGLITDGDYLGSIFLQYYDSSGNLINGTSGGTSFYAFANTEANGGHADPADDVRNSLLYFGCGTANLQNQTINSDARPSNHTNWAYYKIQGRNAAGSAIETKAYYFYRYGSGAKVDDRHQSCTRYDNVRLAWRNRLGAWDYMNFRGKSTESVDITRSDMGSVPGTWDNLTFNYDTWDRGKKTLYTEATRKLTINSDWLNPDEGAWLEELFTSTNVQILGDDNIVYPVILTDKTYTKKTSVNNKIKIQYTIKLEYANKVRTNS